MFKLLKLWRSHVLVMFVYDFGTSRASLLATLITSYCDRKAVCLLVSPARPDLQLPPLTGVCDVLVTCLAYNARHSLLFSSNLAAQHEDTSKTGSFRWKSFRGEKDEKEIRFQITNGR